VQDLESFFHTSKKTPTTTYGAWFDRAFRKVPSYLRRAATMAAHGAVSSFMTRYRTWQGSERKTRTNRPPRWSPPQVWPALYTANGGAGAMMKRLGDAVALKLFDKTSGDWLWRKATIVKRGSRHHVAGVKMRSPSLVVHGSKIRLSQPCDLPRIKTTPLLDQVRLRANDVVCAVDQGINKQAVCSIVRSDGTVLTRTFISLATHIDRRNNVLVQIRKKARATTGKGGKLSRGFCCGLYARAAGINTHIARETARRILAFALGHGVHTIVFEDLTCWRPKGGRKRSLLKERFHGWLHRLLVKQVSQSAEERGIRIWTVPLRGTSSWAYDGSGLVRRGRVYYGRCEFAYGKEYDCDLSASNNIAARFFVARAKWLEQAAARKAGSVQHTPAKRNLGWPIRGRRSGEQSPSAVGPRMPVTLSTLWETARLGSLETQTTAA
jgi:putative transposase